MTEDHEDPGSEEQRGPYRLTGLVATTWRFYTARFAPLLVTFVLANALASAPLFIDFDSSSTADRLLASFLGLVVAVFLSLAVAVSAAICEAYLKDEYIGPREAWRRSIAPNLGPVLATTLLAGLILYTVGTAMPPVALMLRPMFYGPPILIQIVVIEGLAVGPGWARAKELMKGHWGRVLTYLMTIALGLYLLSSSALFAVAGPLAGTSDGMLELLLEALVVLVLSLTYPFVAVASYVAYADIAALED